MLLAARVFRGVGVCSGFERVVSPLRKLRKDRAYRTHVIEATARTINCRRADSERFAHLFVVAEHQRVISHQQESVGSEGLIEGLRTLVGRVHKQVKSRCIKPRKKLRTKLRRVLAATTREVLAAHGVDRIGVERKQFRTIKLRRRLHDAIKSEVLQEKRVVELLDVMTWAPTVERQEIADGFR